MEDIMTVITTIEWQVLVVLHAWEWQQKAVICFRWAQIFGQPNANQFKKAVADLVEKGWAEDKDENGEYYRLSTAGHFVRAEHRVHGHGITVATEAAG